LVEWIRETNLQIFRSAKVNITKTFYLDVTVEEGLARALSRDEGRKDYFDSKGEEFFEKARQGYLNEITYHKTLPSTDKNLKRIIFVPQDSVENTHNVIYGQVKKYLN